MPPIRGFLALLAMLVVAVPQAFAVALPVTAGVNSVAGGVGLNAYDVLLGETIIVATIPGQQWQSGEGLAATGPAGLMGVDFTHEGFTAPLGALVGEIAGLYRLLGAAFTGTAWADGELRLFHWGSAGAGVAGTIEVLVTLESATPGVIFPGGTAVPVPGAAPLLAAGLLGLAALRRRR